MVLPMHSKKDACLERDNMQEICFIAPQLRYFDSYWDMFDTIAQEGKYLASKQALPKESTKLLFMYCIEEKVPFRLVLDHQTNQIVGWCDAQMCGEGICSLGIGLLKDYRERGIGSRLISEMFAIVRKQGYYRMELDVRSSNLRAIHVYEKLGFYTTKVKRDAFCCDGYTEDILRMECEL